MWSLYRSAMYWFAGLNKQEWVILLVVVMLIGCMCMRGYGSRSNY